MSGGSTPRSRRTSFSRCCSQTSPGTSAEATWPVACTPASVRPATVSATGTRRTVASAASSSPWTVRRPGWAAQPDSAVPSYWTSSRTRTSPPPESGTGSSGCCGKLSERSLGVGRGLATGRMRPGRGRVAELGGLHLGGGRGGHLGRDVVAVDEGEVLRLGLRPDVAVVLPLAVGVVDVGDDLLRLLVDLAGGHGRGRVAAGAGGLALERRALVPATGGDP